MRATSMSVLMSILPLSVSVVRVRVFSRLTVTIHGLLLSPSSPHIIYHFNVSGIHPANNGVNSKDDILKDLINHPRIRIYKFFKIMLFKRVNLSMLYRHYGGRAWPFIKKTHLAKYISVFHHGKGHKFTVRSGLACLYLAFSYDIHGSAIFIFFKDSFTCLVFSLFYNL